MFSLMYTSGVTTFAQFLQYVQVAAASLAEDEIVIVSEAHDRREHMLTDRTICFIDSIAVFLGVFVELALSIDRRRWQRTVHVFNLFSREDVGLSLGVVTIKKQYQEGLSYRDLDHTIIVNK